MCLIAKENYKTAKEDIVCYKILHKNYYGDLYSPFTLFGYKIDEVTTAKGRSDIIRYENGSKEISRGYLHTFKTRKAAEHYCCVSQSVYKCIIPKGTTYWEGTFQGYSGFASKKLIVKENIWKR